MRTIQVNGVTMYKCVKCGAWFPFDSRKRIAVCSSCINPEPPKLLRHIDFEKFREVNAEYINSLYEKRRERQRRNAQRRRAAKANVAANFTAEDWERCKETFQHRCAYCGRKRKLTQDHIVPVIKGGGYTIDNIVPACLSCNVSKRDNDMSEWYRRQPFYLPERERFILEYIERSRVK
jgi:5-methylcytosine-specific restriction endonuclease McrA